MKKTGQTTTAGKPVYEKDGDNISELSVTTKIGNKYYNAPSFYNGKEYTEGEVNQMIRDGKIKPTSVHNNLTDAISAAEKRSKSLLPKKYGGKVYTRKAMHDEI